MSKASVVSIAAACGVSPSTVCRALNGKPGVNPRTLAKVMDARARLGYSKNAAASNLRLRRPEAIVGVMAEADHELFIEKLRALRTLAARAGHSWTTRSYRDAAEAELFVREALCQSPAGIVSTWEGLDALAQSPLFLDVPALAFDWPSAQFDHVALDRSHGYREATRYLLRQGCLRPLLLGFGFGCARGQGVRQALAERGLEPDPTLVVDLPFGHDLAQYGHSQTQAALGRVDFDAVLAVNDNCAIGALRALHEAGVAVPGRVRVVGFDDIMLSGHVIPALTTISQPKEAMADYAIKFLLNRIGAPGLSRQTITLRPSLVVRESA